MALLRMIALAGLACAGCRRTEAAPAPQPAPSAPAPAPSGPAGWKPAPELAKAAAAAAKSDAVKVLASDAWSEPAMGCYGLSLRLQGGPAAIDRAADDLVAGITKAGATTQDVAKPAAGERGILALRFTKPPYRGALRAELASTGAISTVTCVWNQREPKACEAACKPLLEAIR